MLPNVQILGCVLASFDFANVRSGADLLSTICGLIFVVCTDVVVAVSVLNLLWVEALCVLGVQSRFGNAKMFIILSFKVDVWVVSLLVLRGVILEWRRLSLILMSLDVLALVSCVVVLMELNLMWMDVLVVSCDSCCWCVLLV